MNILGVRQLFQKNEHEDFKEIFAIEREKILHALNGQMWKGDDGSLDTMTYADCTREEATKEILHIFDQVVKYSKQNIAIQRGMTDFLIEVLGAETFMDMTKFMIEGKYIEKEMDELF